MDISDRIKILRTKKNMTQEELSKVLHVSRSCVSNWENGRRTPDLDSLNKMSKYFEVALEELVKNTDQIVKENIQEVSNITRNKKLKITTVLKIITTILIVVIITLTTTITVLVSKSINQKDKYNSDIIYVEEIEDIYLEVYDGNNRNAFIFSKINREYINKNYHIMNLENDRTYYYIENLEIKIPSVIEKNVWFYVKPRIKYFLNQKMYSYNTQVIEIKNNLIGKTDGDGLIVNTGTYDFILYIENNCCYIGAFSQE